MKWTVKVKRKCDDGKIITLTSSFQKKYQCDAYIRGVGKS